MRIRLDSDKQPHAADVTKLELELEQLVADERVAARLLAEAVAEMQAMDGLTGVLSRVLGSRERNLQDAEARVRRAQRVLQQTRDQRKRTSEQLEQARAGASAAADADVERTMALELLADRIRGTRHPGAALLGELEQQLGDARGELELESDLVVCGEAVMASLSGLVALLQRTESYVAGEMMGALGRGVGLTGALSLRDVNARLQRFGTQVQRFRAAAVAAGVELTVGGQDLGPLPWALHLGTDSLGPEMYMIRRIVGHRQELDSARDELDLILGPHRERLSELRTQTSVLDSQRTAHLESCR